ncbi:helix-turn-helix domain-containing protein [Patulibacter sp. NPDC049589]|uniref:helix-turn-helix domain-containing protein n=1 Tax=Patulibacter sp. NPDC049589 TaxID=3154731 RepID=UPI003445469C
MIRLLLPVNAPYTHAISVVAGRLGPELLADAATSAVLRALPVSAGRLDDETLSGPVPDAVLAGCRLLLAVLADTEATDERRRFAAACREVVFWGPTPEDVLRALHVGAPVVWSRLVNAASPDELPGVLASGRRLLVFMGIATEVVRALEELQLEGLPTEESLARHLLRGVESGVVDQQVREATARLGLERPDPRRPFVVVADRRGTWEWGRRAQALRHDGVLAVTRPGRIEGFAGDGDAGLRELPGATTVVADEAGTQTRRPAWSELAHAARVARDLGRTGVVRLHDVAVESLLAATPSSAARLRAIVSVLRTASGSAGHTDLLTTARTLLDCDLNRAEAAERLGVHATTVGYRQARLETLLGLQLRSPRHRSVLHLAFVADALGGRTPTPRRAGRLTAGRGVVPVDLAARIDRDAIAARLVIALSREVPGVRVAARADPRTVQAEAREFVDDALRMLGGGVVRAPAPSRSPRRLWIRGPETTSAVAARGLAVSGRVLWDALLAEATPEESGRLPPVASEIVRLTTAAELHAREPRGAAAPVSAERSARIVAVLVSGSPQAARVARTAEAWRVDPDEVLRPVVVVPTDERAGERAAQELRARGWVAAMHRRRVVALAPARTEGLDLAHPPRLVALGVPGTADQLPTLVADAAVLADVAMARGATGTVHATEWELDLLVAANPAAAERLRERAVLPLADSSRRGVGLLETLVRYLEHDLDRVQTAAVLRVHPNTLDARLQHIAERTGLGFTRTADLFELSLGVAAHLRAAR